MNCSAQMVGGSAVVLFSVLVLCSPFASGAIPRSPTPSCGKSLAGVQCGANVRAEVRDPFGRRDADGSCRSLLNCKNYDGDLGMEINSFEYYVESVDYATRTLVIRSMVDVAPFGYTGNDALITQTRSCSVESADAFPGATWCGHGCCYNTAACGESQFTPTMRLQEGRGSSLRGGSVDVWRALQSGFELTWAAGDEASGCEACVQSGGVCRNLWAPQNVAYCYCPRDCCNPVFPERIDESKGHKSPAKFITGGVVASLVFLLLCDLCCLRTISFPVPMLQKKRTKPRKDQDLGEFLEKFGSLPPKRYSYCDVKKMTFNFSKKLGQGGYGSVYKGKLEDGPLVAVKILNDSQGTGKEFFSEVISIGYTYHVNIVTLLGFCLEDSKRILIYEFMPNGSLEKFIYVKNDERDILDRKMLLRIAIGIARGLQYMHHGCNIGILHCDIKPSNILLDQNFCPKIADFGLAKICRSAERKMKMLDAGGTVGYIAPEVFLHKFGGVSSKSDVYSYGMMLLEMVGGRKKIYMGMNNTTETFLPHWIYKHIDLDGGFISSNIITEAEGELARRMVVIGLWCIQTNPSDRPSMTKVLNMLEGRIAELQMPAMPFLYSPLVSAHSSPPVNQAQGQTSVAASSSKHSLRDTLEPKR